MKTLTILTVAALTIISCNKKNDDPNIDTSNLVNKKWALLYWEKHKSDGTVEIQDVSKTEWSSLATYSVFYSDGTYSRRNNPYYDLFDTGRWWASGHALKKQSNQPNFTNLPNNIITLTADTFRYSFYYDDEKQDNIQTYIITQ